MSSAGSHLHTASVSSKTLRCSKIASAPSAAVTAATATTKAALTGELRHDTDGTNIYLCIKGGGAGADEVVDTLTPAAAAGQQNITFAAASVIAVGDVVTGHPGLVPFCTVTNYVSGTGVATVSANLTAEIVVGTELMFSKPGKSIWKQIAIAAAAAA